MLRKPIFSTERAVFRFYNFLQKAGFEKPKIPNPDDGKQIITRGFFEILGDQNYASGPMGIYLNICFKIFLVITIILIKNNNMLF